MTLFIQHSRNDEIIEIGEQDEWRQGLGEGEGRAWAAAGGDSVHNPEVELSAPTLGDHTIRQTLKKFRWQENHRAGCRRFHLPRHPPPPCGHCPRGPGSKTRPSQATKQRFNVKSQSKHLVLHFLIFGQKCDTLERFSKWI